MAGHSGGPRVKASVCGHEVRDRVLRCRPCWREHRRAVSEATLEARFRERFLQGPECWVWTGVRTKGGYGQLGRRYAHRYSYELAFGQIPAGMSVRHSCDNPPCVRPDHLSLGTQNDNMRDMVARDRQGRAKLTWGQVHDIRQRYEAGGITQQQLADEHGVLRVAIYEILHGRSWREVA
jgi:hypothetical protein